MESPDNPPAGLCGIIGSGGHACVVAATLANLNMRLAAVFDTDVQRIGQPFGELTVQIDDPRSGLPVHIAIGSNSARRRVAEEWEKHGHRVEWQTLIHPTAQIAEGVVLGDGVLVGMGAIIQAGAAIGNHVIINSGALVEHHCVIGDYAHLAPGAILGGGVFVGADVLVGLGSVVLPGVVICDGATIGAGSVVTRSVSAGATVMGAPARSTTGAA